MLLVYKPAMGQSLVSVGTATVMSDFESTAGERGATRQAGESLFPGLLGQAINQSLQAGTAGAASSETATPLDLAELLSTLIGQDGKGFIQVLQGKAGASAEAGTVAAGADGAKEATVAAGNRTVGSGEDGSGATGPELKSLLVGLLSLVFGDNASHAAKSGATGSSDGEASEGTGDPSYAARASEDGGAAGKSKEDGQPLLETVALLLFAGMQAILAGQSGVAGSADGARSAVPENGNEGGELTAAYGTGSPREDGNFPSAGLPAIESRNMGERNEDLKVQIAFMPSTEGAAGEKNAILTIKSPFGAGDSSRDAGGIAGNQAGSTVAAGGTDGTQASGGGTGRQKSEDKESYPFAPAGEIGPAKERNEDLKVQITFMSPREGDAGKKNAILTIKSPFGAGDSSRDAGGIAGNQAGSTVAAGGTDGVNVIAGAIKDAAPLAAGPDGTQASGGGTGRQKSEDKESYPFAPAGEIGPASESGQEQNKPGGVHSAWAVEKFDRVLEQLEGKTGLHDLKVRLSLGNEESLVVGMKDLGPTVSVDVRSSDQAMIGLLQSQRDTIIRHLEGQDIHAQIVIDPNASQTPERRDKQETRQKTFTPLKRGGEGFDTFLDTFV